MPNLILTDNISNLATFLSFTGHINQPSKLQSMLTLLDFLTI